MRTHLRSQCHQLWDCPHMGVIGCPPNREAKGWGKRNRPWGFGRAPLHTLDHGLSADKVVLSVLLLAGTLLYQDLWSKADWRARLPISAHPWSAEEHLPPLQKCQDHIIIRQDQTRMRRPNIKTSRWDRMEIDPPEFLTHWARKTSMAGSALQRN